ncbi:MULTISPECIES: DUF1648 domain-containing protein [unclassified Arthrobacter]|uniref:DUF1648 domain-containing protein n=1 Tax=unclassified Arthrobacter TaxID=235627 RepID=UPI0011AFDAA6|nr:MULTISPECIES: DUF1648 domain-containing protein [unclassified Arthrobacter]
MERIAIKALNAGFDSSWSERYDFGSYERIPCRVTFGTRLEVLPVLDMGSVDYCKTPISLGNVHSNEWALGSGRRKGAVAEQKKTYSRNWAIGSIVGLLVLALSACGWMYSVQSRLPAKLAVHWNGRGEVDEFATLANVAISTVLLTVFVGVAICWSAILLRAHSLMLARIGLGFGVALSSMVAGLFLALVAGQIDRVTAEHAAFSSSVIAGAIVVSVLAGFATAMAYRPEEIVREQSVEAVRADELANDPDSSASRTQEERAAHRAVHEIPLRVTPLRYLLVAFALLAVLVGWYMDQFYIVFSSIVAGAICWIFFAGTFVVDSAGTRFVASGFWKVMKLDYAGIKGVHIKDIKALDYGGWGYRSDISDRGFITGDGPAVLIDMGYHQQHVISMPDVKSAIETAALINAYRALEAAKSSN